MEIRPMTVIDYDIVLNVWEQSGLVIDPELDSKENISAFLLQNKNLSFVAVQNSQIIGAILGSYNCRMGWVYHLGVLPTFQHLGIGSRLIATAEQALTKAGAVKIMLTVRQDNLDVVPFYEKRGYVPFTRSEVFEKTISTGIV